ARHPPGIKPRSAERRLRPRRDALGIVEVKHHRRTLRGGNQQVLEAAQRVWPDCFLYIGRQQKAIGALAAEEGEVIGPDVDHHLAELPLRDRGAHDRELLELTAELAEL